MNGMMMKSRAPKGMMVKATMPPIDDDRIVWDVAFFAERYNLSCDAVAYHMRRIWGKVRRGERRRLSYDQAVRFDRYVQRVRHHRDGLDARVEIA